jgi:hypothetical protein
VELVQIDTIRQGRIGANVNFKVLERFLIGFLSWERFRLTCGAIGHKVKGRQLEHIRRAMHKLVRLHARPSWAQAKERHARLVGVTVPAHGVCFLT